MLENIFAAVWKIFLQLLVVAPYWGKLVVRGLLAIIFGLMVFASTQSALLTIIFVFAAYAIIDGIVTLFVALRERDSFSHWRWALFEGILSILAGILAFVYPHSLRELLYLVAAWAILTSLMEIMATFAIREYVSREWALVLAGVLSIVFGIILLVFPGAVSLSTLWLVGIYRVVFGILFIIRAFQLRSWAERI